MGILWNYTGAVTSTDATAVVKVGYDYGAPIIAPKVYSITYDGTTVEIYVNGELVQSTTKAYAGLSTLPILYLGADYDDTCWFKGILPEFIMFNNKLNAVEYHRCSEIDIAATDLILMLGLQQDINYDNNTYETSKIEQFFIPAGTAVELYATTLHFAPSRQNNEEFRCGIVLIKDTNLPLETIPTDLTGENRLLFARNKWLICHSESKPATRGGCIGLIGKNLEI